jgi:hypothetical protein
MHLKVFVKLKKTLKTSLLGKKTPKNQKNQKTHWAGLKKKKKPGFFPTLRRYRTIHLECGTLLKPHSAGVHTVDKLEEEQRKSSSPVHQVRFIFFSPQNAGIFLDILKLLIDFLALLMCAIESSSLDRCVNKKKK